MVQAFDHRAASVVVNPENLNRPAQPKEATLADHSDPAWSPDPQFWVAADEVEWPEGVDWALAFKDVTAPTNVRTMIAAIVPRSGVGNTLPLLLPENTVPTAAGAEALWLLAANFNSFVFDFVARQKVQGQHLNWFIVEQLPLIAPEEYERRFGDKTAREIVRDHTLRLTCTAEDLTPFARDLGHDGPPFPWNEEGRRHLRATARRPLLPALRRLPRRCRPRFGDVPHRSPSGRRRVRPLPDPRPDPRLHECTVGGGSRESGRPLRRAGGHRLTRTPTDLWLIERLLSFRPHRCWRRHDRRLLSQITQESDER